jgi:hypothetical protein
MHVIELHLGYVKWLALSNSIDEGISHLPPIVLI